MAIPHICMYVCRYIHMYRYIYVCVYVCVCMYSWRAYIFILSK